MFQLAYNGLVRVNDLIVRVCGILIGGLLAVIVSVLFYAVLCRYFFSSPISWGGDFTLLALVWMTLLGAPVGMRNGHISTEFVLDIMPPFMTRLMNAVIGLAVLFVSVLVLVYGFALVEQGMARIVPSMDWLSQGYFYLCLPVGFALVLPLSLERVFVPFLGASSNRQDA
jgi:TRAP-type C4-dicarboxylate transport system permease small subunit